MLLFRLVWLRNITTTAGGPVRGCLEPSPARCSPTPRDGGWRRATNTSSTSYCPDTFATRQRRERPLLPASTPPSWTRRPPPTGRTSGATSTWMMTSTPWRTRAQSRRATPTLSTRAAAPGGGRERSRWCRRAAPRPGAAGPAGGWRRRWAPRSLTVSSASYFPSAGFNF